MQIQMLGSDAGEATLNSSAGFINPPTSLFPGYADKLAAYSVTEGSPL